MHSIGSEVAACSTQISVTFVDQDSFKRLQSTHFKMEDFAKLVRSGKPSTALSVMSHAYLAELNRLISDLVLGRIEDYQAPVQTPKEIQYTTYAVWEDMTQSLPTCALEPPELCYDALPLDAQSLLIVVQKGFLYHLAGNKDNYKQFVLACIGCMDRFNCDLSQLNQLYLQLQLSDAPFELLRCRIQ